MTPPKPDVAAGGGLGWRWQSFGGAPMLVTDGGGAKVVLCAGQISGVPVLMTRDEATGCLRGLVAADTFPSLIAAAPVLFEAGAKVLAWWDEKLANELSSNRDFPWAEDAEWSEFNSLRAALAKAGQP